METGWTTQEEEEEEEGGGGEEEEEGGGEGGAGCEAAVEVFLDGWERGKETEKD